MPVTKICRKTDFEGVSAVEAAWLAELPAKTINATIDRGELVCASRKRGLSAPDVLYLVLRKEVGEALSAAGKRELYSKLTELQSPDWTSWLTRASRCDDVDVPLADGMLRVELKPACLRLAKRFKALRQAVNVIVEDPDIRAGEPVVRGTRIPVYLVADLLAQGADAKEILEDYPALTATKLRAVLAYLQTHPKRGRPRRHTWKRRRSQAGVIIEPMNADSR